MVSVNIALEIFSYRAESSPLESPPVPWSLPQYWRYIGDEKDNYGDSTCDKIRIIGLFQIITCKGFGVTVAMAGLHT